MLKFYFKILILVIIVSSCKTNQYLIKSPELLNAPMKEVIILKNNRSFLIPVGIYPKYKIIDKFIIDSKPAIQPIDSLLYKQLTSKNISCKIVETDASLEPYKYYLTYQDYWAWDFKKYMHVLKISILNPEGKEVMRAASEGNTSGLHNYPNPVEQVPLLIDLILQNNNINQ